jgi:hypothetical protein
MMVYSHYNPGYPDYHTKKDRYDAWTDAKDRSVQALKDFPQFYDKEHMITLKKVEKIVKDFFAGCGAKFYVNHRPNNGNDPFSTITAHKARFPQNLTEEEKKAQYYEPLEKLGAVILHSTSDRETSYIHRLYCLGRPDTINLPNNNKLNLSVMSDVPLAKGRQTLNVTRNLRKLGKGDTYEFVNTTNESNDAFLKRIRSRMSYYNRMQKGKLKSTAIGPDRLLITRIR